MKVTLQELYSDMMGMFTNPSGDMNWAMVFEPVANYYPSGLSGTSAWSSPSDIAQVLAEKSFSSIDLYKDAHQVAFGNDDYIRPDEGSYTRYYAQLFYQMRNTNIFSNFLFRETRAIFTNNFRGGNYQANEFLLADSLRPEVNNDNNFLGGWAIVYLRDLVDLPPAVNALRYGLLIDLNAPSSTRTVLGNSVSFAPSPPTTLMKWFHPSTRVSTEVYLDITPTLNTMVVGSALGIPSISTYTNLYSATQMVYMDQAWLSSHFSKNSLLPDLSSYDFNLLQPVLSPASGNTIGTGKFVVPESSVRALFDASGRLILEAIKSIARASINPSVRTTTETDNSLALGSLNTFVSGLSGTDYAVSFLSSSASIVATQVKDSSGNLRDSLDDGKPLMSLNGNMPITFALKLPENVVLTRIITIKADEPDATEESFAFDISELFEYEPIGSCPAIVLGWNSDTAAIDTAVLQNLASSLPSVLSSVDPNAIKLTTSADKVFLLNCGDKITTAASVDGSGGFIGATVVVLVPPKDNTDLVMLPLAVNPNSTGTKAEIDISVVNTTARLFDTYLTIRVTATGIPAQDFVMPVSLQPDYNFFTQVVDLPPDGGTVFFVAEVNPAPHNVDEIDYSNNITSDSFLIPAPPLLVPPDPSCVSTYTWRERRSHAWSIWTPPSDPANDPCGGYNSYYYCVHEYTYRITLTASVTYDYRYEGTDYIDEPTIHRIKSGYGFTPKIAIDYLVELISQQRIAGTNCTAARHISKTTAPTSNTQASIVLPSEGYLSWYGGWRGVNHNQDDYNLFNPERMTRQYYNGIPFTLDSQTGDTLSGTLIFLPAPNLLSNSNQQKVL